jgi:hypothetical protein
VGLGWFWRRRVQPERPELRKRHKLHCAGNKYCCRSSDERVRQWWNLGGPCPGRFLFDGQCGYDYNRRVRDIGCNNEFRNKLCGSPQFYYPPRTCWRNWPCRCHRCTGSAGPAGTNGSGVNAITFAMEFINPGTTGTTFYMSPLSSQSTPTTASNGAIASAAESNFTAMPVACTMSALNVGINNYNAPASDTTTITMYKNQVATAMTCSGTTNGNRSGCRDTNTCLFGCSWR